MSLKQLQLHQNLILVNEKCLKRKFGYHLDRHLDFEMNWYFTNYFIYMLLLCSSLGRPRRFSEQFLTEEKHKLNQYRESVRSHYAEVLAGTKEGLPADLAQPLIVGQRVIAIHPKTREIHDGSILTVDHCRYRVQFDQHELGVEFVMVCFPLF